MLDRLTSVNPWWVDTAEDVATAYTAQKPMMKLLGEHPQAELIRRHEDEDGNVTSEEWVIPKELVVIR